VEWLDECCCLIAARFAAASRRFSGRQPPAPSDRSPRRAPAILRRGGAVLPLDEEPSGLDRIEATPLSGAGDRAVLRGVVAPRAAGSQRPQQQGAAALRGLGLREEAPAPPPTVQAADWERLGNGRFLPGSTGTRQKRNTKTWTWRWWRSVLSGPILSMQKICATFFGQWRHGPCC